jgi:cysteinyl-tRNA synthetase
VLTLVCVLLLWLCASPTFATSPGAERQKLLADVTSWRYQLRRLDIDEIAASPADLAVIDYAPDRYRGIEEPFPAEAVARMQRKPDGRRRLLLAYLSIGEAERYRTYWNNDWYEPTTRPAWLIGAANPRWDGNFPVRFWHPGWQQIVLGSPQAYLDRILAAGFDGVYLDRADVFQELARENQNGARDMGALIARIARYARAMKPDALVVMQNAEELIARPEVRDAIDAIAKEDWLYGVSHEEKANPADMVRDSLGYLRRAKSRGLRVLVVEYLSDPGTARAAEARIRREGFLPLIAERSLGTLEFAPSGKR